MINVFNFKHLIFLLLFSCSSGGYKAYDSSKFFDTGGYFDEKIGKNLYLVGFAGVQGETKIDVEKYFLRRSYALANENGFSGFCVTNKGISISGFTGNPRNRMTGKVLLTNKTDDQNCYE